jgi:MATE family multidrug resistance protein
MIFAFVGYWGSDRRRHLAGLRADWKGVGIWIGLASGLAIVAVLMLALAARAARLA